MKVDFCFREAIFSAIAASETEGFYSSVVQNGMINER